METTETTPQKFNLKQLRQTILLVITGLVGIYLAYNSNLWYTLIEEKNTFATIGTLTKKGGGVRHKLARSPLWNDIGEEETKVGQGDSIFTGEDGYAKLTLKDGNVIDLQPKSLIVVDVQVKEIEENPSVMRQFSKQFFSPPPGSTQIKVNQGELKIQSGSYPLAIQSQNKNFEIKSQTAGESVDVNVDPNNPDKPVQFANASSDKVAVEQNEKTGNQVMAIAQDPPELKEFKKNIEEMTLAKHKQKQFEQDQMNEKLDLEPPTSARSKHGKTVLLMLVGLLLVMWFLEVATMVGKNPESKP